MNKCDNCGSDKLRFYLQVSDDRSQVYKRYRCRVCGMDDYAE